MALTQHPIPARMKAVQVTSYNQPYRLNTVPVSTPRAHDLLVKVAVASYCHTDSLVARGGFGTPLPATASHEGAGTVVAVGPDVKTFRPGDRVMCGLPRNPCEACHDCRGPVESHRQYCLNIEGQAGVHLDGCMAEYALVDARTSVPLPLAVSFVDAAPLACAGRTVWRGVKETGLVAGDCVALIGSGGGLGHLGIQFAKALGLRVVAVDARDEGLDLSRQYGADAVIDARMGKEAVVQQVQSLTDGQGADSTLVLSDAPEATGLAAAVTKMHGEVVQIALPESVSVPFFEVIFRDVRIKGSLIASPEESKAMLDFVASHGIKVKTNVFHGLESIGALVKEVHGGKVQGKAVVVVDPEQVEQEKKLRAKL